MPNTHNICLIVLHLLRYTILLSLSYFIPVYPVHIAHAKPVIENFVFLFLFSSFSLAILFTSLILYFTWFFSFLLSLHLLPGKPQLHLFLLFICFCFLFAFVVTCTQLCIVCMSHSHCYIRAFVKWKKSCKWLEKLLVHV